MGQCRGDRDDFLHERDAEVLGKRQSARTRDHRCCRNIACAVHRFLHKRQKRLTDIGIVAAVIGIFQVVVLIQQRNLYRRRTDVNAQLIEIRIFIHRKKPFNIK